MFTLAEEIRPYVAGVNNSEANQLSSTQLIRVDLEHGIQVWAPYLKKNWGKLKKTSEAGPPNYHQ